MNRASNQDLSSTCMMYTSYKNETGHSQPSLSIKSCMCQFGAHNVGLELCEIFSMCCAATLSSYASKFAVNMMLVCVIGSLIGGDTRTKQNFDFVLGIFLAPVWPYHLKIVRCKTSVDLL